MNLFPCELQKEIFWMISDFNDSIAVGPLFGLSITKVFQLDDQEMNL